MASFEDVPLFGDDLKAAGMAQALDAHDVRPWAVQARETVELLAGLGSEFTSEDVVERVGLPRVDVGTNRNNAVGAVMSGAARAGLIRRVGYRPAQRKASHSAVLAVWVGTRG